jgi:cytochrome c556
MMAHHQKQSMRDHLVAVQEIVAAVAADDLPSAERAAGRLGSSETMGRMCSHMGAGAPGFTQQALAFHRTADGIVAAAREGNRPQLLSALNATLHACTSCHSAWKQQVVDQTTWERVTTGP